VSISVDAKRELDRLRVELGVKTYEELVRTLLASYRRCRELLTREKVLGVLCGEFHESSASLSAWAKLLAKKLDGKDEVAMALGFLVPNPNVPGEFIVNRDMCTPITGVTPAPEAASAAAPEQPRAVAATSGSGLVGSGETVSAAEEVVEVKPEVEFTTEEYVRNILVPLLKERAGSRAVWGLKELRELLESLTPLPTAEVMNVLTKLGYAELRGNQVVLKRA
jgi:hypothetical protein